MMYKEKRLGYKGSKTDFLLESWYTVTPEVVSREIRSGLQRMMISDDDLKLEFV